MIFSTACLACGNSVVRKVAVELHPFQIGFLTNVLVLILIWPALRLPADPIHRSRRRRLYTLTAVFGGISNLAWFYALANVPLAEATAVTFAAPIIVTACAGIVFGERVTMARWLAIAVGFLGVLLVVRPGFTTIDSGMAALLVATVGMSGSYILSKQLMAVESMRRAAAMMTIIPVAMGALPAAWVWITPSLDTIIWVIVMAGLMYTGRITMLIALRNAPASTVMPFDFGRLPFISAIAYVAFDEVPGSVAMAGAALIVLSSGFIAYQERTKKNN